METVFVLLPVGLSVRNILFTGVVNRLLENKNVRVIVFTTVPDIAERYDYKSNRLIFEDLPPRNRYRLTGLINHILNLRFFSINDDPSLTSTQAKRRWLRRIRPRRHLFETIISQPLPRNKTIYRLLSAFHDRRMRISNDIASLFNRYRPSLVFATNPTAMFEFDLLKYAKHNNISTVGMIHSWDVLTTEGRMVVPLDHYLVWNEIIKGELIKIHGISEEQITITGIPQFDVYAESIPKQGKENFLISENLDPEKQTILFGTSSGGDTPEEPEILERLVKTLNEKMPDKIQILVRIHPRDDVGRYSGITAPNVKFQIPGTLVENLDDRRLWDQAELYSLRDTLAYSDVMVNTASTVSIDAVAIDTPVVNIAFDLHQNDYNQSVRRYFDMVHYKPFVSSGGTKLASEFDQLVQLILRYLEHPKFEQEERAILAKTIGYRDDGKSANRIALSLLESLEQYTKNNLEADYE